VKLKEWVRLHSRGLAHLGIALSDEDFETLIDTVDNDKSGCIDYNGEIYFPF
jgi:Ca2+-binding EF-hand superfamily protein